MSVRADPMEGWRWLSKKTRRRSLLQGTARVVQRPERTVIKHGWILWGGTLAVIGFCIIWVAVFFAITKGEDLARFSFNHIGAYIFISVPILFSLLCILNLMSRTRVELSSDFNELIIFRGIPPFVRAYAFELDELNVELQLAPWSSGKEESSGGWLMGHTLLVLKHKDFEEVIHLASSQTRDALLPAFEAIHGFVGGRAEDKTLETFQLVDGRSINVPVSPMARTASGFRAMAVQVNGNNSISIDSSLELRTLLSLFIIAPLAAMSYIIPGLLDDGHRIGAAITGLAGSAVILAVLAALFSFSGWRLELDRLARRFFIRGRNGTWRTQRFECGMADIAGVQICSRRVSDSEGSNWTANEINLVFAAPEGERFHLVCHGRERAIRKDARLLADFLNVPVLDHT